MEVFLLILLLLGLGNYISAKFGSPEEAARQAGYARNLAERISQHSDEKDPEVAKQKGLEEFEKEHENDPEYKKDKEKFEEGLEKEVLSKDPKDLDKVKTDLEKVETIANNGPVVDETGKVQLSEETKKIINEDSKNIPENNQELVDKLVNRQMTQEEIGQETKEILSQYPNLNIPTETLTSETNKEKVAETKTPEKENESQEIKETPVENGANTNEVESDDKKKEEVEKENNVEQVQKEEEVQKTQEPVQKELTSFKEQLVEQTEEQEKDEEQKFIEDKLKTTKEASDTLQKAQIKSVGYIPKDSKLPLDIQNNGNFNDLMNCFNSVKDDPNYSVDEKNYLIGRCWGARAVDFYDNNRKFTKLGKVEPVTNGDRISFPTLKIKDFQKGNQCWSYAYSLMLESRGVNLKPEYIRAFRPGLGKEDTKKMTELNPADSSFLNRDEPGDPFEVADLVSKTVPNTVMKQETFNTSAEFMKLSPEEKQAEFKQNMLRVLNKALKEDKSPVAMNLNGHIVTVTGMEGDKLLLQDSLQKNHIVKNIQGKILVNGKPGSTTTKSIDALAKAYSQNGKKFGFTWLADVEPTKEGKCDEISKLTDGKFSCENNEIKDNRGFDPVLKESYDIATSTIRNGHVCFNQINSKGLSIEQKVYLPKSLEKPFVVKEYLQEKKEKKDELTKVVEKEKKDPVLQKGDDLSL